MKLRTLVLAIGLVTTASLASALAGDATLEPVTDLVDATLADDASADAAFYAHTTTRSVFNNGCKSSNYLLWECSPAGTSGNDLTNIAHKRQCTSGMSAPTCTAGRTQVADYWGGYWGECVSLVKSGADRTVPATANWAKGLHVMSVSAAQWVAIATFCASNGGYQGHTGFFHSYTYDGGGAKNGFNLWDQNYGDKALRYHAISKTSASGCQTSDANDYHIVQI